MIFICFSSYTNEEGECTPTRDGYRPNDTKDGEVICEAGTYHDRTKGLCEKCGDGKDSDEGAIGCKSKSKSSTFPWWIFIIIGVVIITIIIIIIVFLLYKKRKKKKVEETESMNESSNKPELEENIEMEEPLEVKDEGEAVGVSETELKDEIKSSEEFV
jgi:hypothetical protein